jgi:hypothetical protein
VSISNQFLAIPPDHPLAVELFDLLGLQMVTMQQQNHEAAVVNAGGDRTSYDRHDAAMRIINDEIEALQKKYRSEHGGDESCRVGLTYGVNGYPVVNGRPCAPTLH